MLYEQSVGCSGTRRQKPVITSCSLPVNATGAPRPVDHSSSWSSVTTFLAWKREDTTTLFCCLPWASLICFFISEGFPFPTMLSLSLLFAFISFLENQWMYYRERNATEIISMPSDSIKVMRLLCLPRDKCLIVSLFFSLSTLLFTISRQLSREELKYLFILKETLDNSRSSIRSLQDKNSALKAQSWWWRYT